MQKTGLFELMPELLKTKVYAGISAGSIIAGPSWLYFAGYGQPKRIQDGRI